MSTAEKIDVFALAAAVNDLQDRVADLEDAGNDLAQAVEPAPFKVGDRVRTIAKNTAVAPIGTTGTITYDANKYDFPYSVKFDEPQGGFLGDLFAAEELELLPEPVPIKITYPFKPGDRVVYTIPETYLGYPGTAIAVRPEGTRGVVKSQNDSGSVRVDWEDGGILSTSPVFVAPDVEPTHRHPEGVYTADGGRHRVFVSHEATRENYRLVYIDDTETEVEGNVPVNHNISGAYLNLAYTLVATA